MITREECVQELIREKAQRARVYPRLIADGRLKPEQAEIQNARLDAAIDYLATPNLFSEEQ